MWPKDDYQEHMLGYLDGVRVEFERLVPSPQRDRIEFYANLDSSLECLWQLIRASEVEWEAYRYPLETQCAELLRMLARAGVWIPSAITLRSIRLDAPVIVLEPEIEAWVLEPY